MGWECRQRTAVKYLLVYLSLIPSSVSPYRKCGLKEANLPHIGEIR